MKFNIAKHCKVEWRYNGEETDTWLLYSDDENEKDFIMLENGGFWGNEHVEIVKELGTLKLDNLSQLYVLATNIPILLPMERMKSEIFFVGGEITHNEIEAYLDNDLEYILNEKHIKIEND